MKFSLVLAVFVLSACASAAAPERIGAVELDSSDRYPVVYVTDSNYLLPSAAATYLAQATDETHMTSINSTLMRGLGYVLRAD